MIRAHPASFGDVQFDVTNWSDNNTRAIDRNRPVNKEGANLRNRGREPRETQCEIIFFNRKAIDGEQPQSQLDFYERFKLFIVKALNGRVEDFVHPMAGGYRAMVEDVEVAGDAEQPQTLFVSCRFVEDSTDPSPFVTGTERPLSAGFQDAATENADARAQVAAVGGDTSFADDVDATLAKWRDPDLSRDIAKDLGKVTRTIEGVQKTAELASDPASYAAFRATERLMYRMRLAAEAARSTQKRTRTATVKVAQPLRQWIAANLSATDTEGTYEEIMNLNQIADPGYLEVGTELRVPTTDAPQVDYIGGPSR